MLIRAAHRRDDRAAIWSVIGPTIRAGDTYALDPRASEAAALAYWCGPDKDVLVAEDQGALVGTYYLRANHAGGGDHVCNCGYITSATARGRGVARSMCAHSLDLARDKGFRAMQFNFVVSTNEAALRLWQDMEFVIVGTLPAAFLHPTQGFVDAFVMFRQL